MSDKAALPSNSKQNDVIAYAAIALFVALSYVLLRGQYIAYLRDVLPHGDWFTYTIAWFTDLDFYRKHGYWLTLAAMLAQPNNWYRLMNLGVALLAPILAKQPYVICIVNYVLFGIATIAFYRLGRRLGCAIGGAFIIALIPWIWPVNYGFEDYTSLPVTGLDAAFNAVLLWAAAQTFIFAFDLQEFGDRANRKTPLGQPTVAAAKGRHLTASAVLTGLVVGIAVWGRGNSLPVVGLVVLWPGLLALWVVWRSRAAVLWMDLVIAGAIAALIAGEFYIQYWTILLKYYGVHASYVEAHRWSYAGARQFILNVPGFMYWRAEDSPLCIGLTFASHLFVVLALVASWWPGNPLRAPRFFRFRQLVTGGAVIYFGTYLVDMIFFANDQPGFSIYQSLLVWRPMLIGLSLILTAIVAEILRSFPFKFESFAAAAIALAALAWGFIWTQVYTPSNQSESWPSPRVVERFALNLDRLADNGPVAVLWYHGWNEPILNYYRLANDLPPANFFTGGQSKYDHFVNALPPVTWLHPLQYYHRVMNDWRAARQLNVEHHDAMWSLADYSEENRARALEQVKYQFTHAALIILPEYLDQYKSDEPYAFYKFKEDWAAWLSSEAAPRFRVVMLLHETPSERLLVIRREDVAPSEGDPLRLPYGERPESSPPDYSNAVTRVR